MGTPVAAENSRRSFLKSLFLTATATATGGLLSAPARAAAPDAGGGSDVVKPFAAGGFQIADHVVGPVVVRGDDYDYLLYDAWELDGDGVPSGSGVGVVRLTECADWRFRNIGDEHLIDHPVDHAELDAGETYEVHNSTWVANLIEEDPALAGPDAPKWHHYIFSFGETTFECVLGRYDTKLHAGAFDDLLDDLA